MPTVMANFEESILDNDTYRVNLVLKTINYLRVHNKYNFVKNIGQGTFGAVVELLCPDEKRSVAVKIVLEEEVSKSEVNLWPELSHENIVPLITAAHIPETHCYVFITPLYPLALNELVEGIGLSKDKRGFQKAISLLKGVCSGVQYLHSRMLCHLDIKLSNVLMNVDGGAVLCDFGSLTHTEGTTDRPSNCLPCEMNDDKHEIIHKLYTREVPEDSDEYVSPYMYRPPEAEQSEYGLKPVVNGFKYDIYTIGLLGLELLTNQALGDSLDWVQGKFSWTEILYPKIFEILQKEKFEQLVKNTFRKSQVKRRTLCDVRDFIRACLNLNPDNRPVADDLGRHVIFDGIKVFRGMKYDAWYNKWNPKKLQFIVNLYKSRAVLLEFKSSYDHSNDNDMDDEKETVDGTDTVQTDNEDIRQQTTKALTTYIADQQNNSESQPTDEDKRSPSDSHDVQIDSKDTSSRCASCDSNEDEFVEIVKKKKFFTRIRSGLIRAFNRICSCCCRKM